MPNLNPFRAIPKYAFRSYNNNDQNSPYRFDQDSERLFHSKEFRRLNGKTQVFVTGFDDHVRNRLTHTLEVNQITQLLIRKLRLNPFLGKAIAFGHDVGHTPFGHVGERTLNLFMNGCGDYRNFNKIKEEYRGFKHNFQGIRVVTFLEKVSSNYPGLDLTNYTLWGILNHTSTSSKPCGFKSKDGKCNFLLKDDFCSNIPGELNYNFYDKYLVQFPQEKSWTMEALVVKMADEIAQRHHDLEDGLYAGIIDSDEIVPEIMDCFKDSLNLNDKKWLSEIILEQDLNICINKLSRFIIEFFTRNLVETSKTNFENLKKKYNIKNSDDFKHSKEVIFRNEEIFNIINYDSGLSLNEQKFQLFLKTRILNSHLAQSMDGKADYILRNLIKAFITNPQQLPNGTIAKFYQRYLSDEEYLSFKGEDPISMNGRFRDRLRKDHNIIANEKYKGILVRTICDFIAGMTDDFAIKQYNMLYGTTNVFERAIYDI